jgi:hypothetical protein
MVDGVRAEYRTRRTAMNRSGGVGIVGVIVIVVVILFLVGVIRL